MSNVLNLIYSATRLYCRIVVKAFFGEVLLIGAERLPPHCPVIFVGNHSNKFMDAAMLIALIPRKLFFLMAQVSLKLVFIGPIARAINAIGIKRAQDCKVLAQGKLRCFRLQKPLEQMAFLRSLTTTDEIARGDEFAAQYNAGKATTPLFLLIGQETNFTCALAAGDRILVAPVALTIKMVLKDNVALASGHIDAADEQIFNQFSVFHFLPRIDYSVVYENVFRKLAQRAAICVFPEGGSHDQPHVLPLKSGVAVMALTAACSGIDNVLIVPCGLSYTERDRFGSTAVLEIGEPIVADKQLMEYFRSGNEVNAIAMLKEKILKALEHYVLCGRDYPTIKAAQLAAQVYTPNHAMVSGEKKHELRMMFVRLLNLMSDDPATIALRKSLSEYQSLLDLQSICDSEVDMLFMGPETAALLALRTLLKLLAYSVLLMPTMPFVLPMDYLLGYFAERHRKECLAKSNVKLTGADVVTSFKIIRLTMALLLFNSLVAFYFALSYQTFILRVATFFWILCGIPLALYLGKYTLHHFKIGWRVLRISYRVTISYMAVSKPADTALKLQRAQVQMKTREYMQKVLGDKFREAHPEYADFLLRTQYAIEAIFPPLIIEADNKQIKVKKTGLLNSAFNFRVFFNEEIL